jgi:hypothetical protein
MHNKKFYLLEKNPLFLEKFLLESMFSKGFIFYAEENKALISNNRDVIQGFNKPFLKKGFSILFISFFFKHYKFKNLILKSFVYPALYHYFKFTVFDYFYRIVCLFKKTPLHFSLKPKKGGFYFLCFGLKSFIPKSQLKTLVKKLFLNLSYSNKNLIFLTCAFFCTLFSTKQKYNFRSKVFLSGSIKFYPKILFLKSRKKRRKYLHPKLNIVVLFKKQQKRTKKIKNLPFKRNCSIPIALISLLINYFLK